MLAGIGNVRHVALSRFNAVEVHARDMRGPPPEQVPRNVSDNGFIATRSSVSGQV
jgi:hypothetical protein